MKGVIPITNLPLLERLLNIPAILFYYLKTFIFPFKLTIDQLWVITALDLRQFYIPLVIDCIFLAGCIGLGVYVYKKNKKTFNTYIFFFLWFLAGMFIHLQILPLDMTVADRWFYVPIAGLLGMIGVGLSLINTIKFSKAFIVTAISIILIFSIRTMVRNANWADNMTLFSHDAKIIDNYEMENNLATFYSLQRQPKEALIHAKKSVELYPYETNLANLAFIYEHLNAYEKAEEYYKKTIATENKSPNYDKKAAFAYLHLGGIYLFHKKPEMAVTIYKEGLEKYPEDGVLWSFLATAQYELKQQEASLTSVQKAKKYFPNQSTNKLYDLIRNKKEFDARTL